MIFNMNASSEIAVRTLTGLKYFNHYWWCKSNKSINKDRRVSLYRNERKSSINLVAFHTNICFQMYQCIDHFRKKNRSSRPEVFCKKGVRRNIVKFIGKHKCKSLFLNKVAGQVATLLKKRVWHKCFSVNSAKFLRTPFLMERLWWLLLKE